jgi:hypothetical protein
VSDNALVYAVRAEFDDDESRELYLSWLRDGHAMAVVRDGGALSGEVTVMDDGTVESRYIFDSRAAFDAYEAGPGVALRAESAHLFPAGSGVRTARSVGLLAVRVPD